MKQPRKSDRGGINYGILSELVGYALRRAQVHMYQDFFRVVAPFDIRPAQFAVLAVIEHNPGLKQSEVAAALGIKRTNFVGLLDALENRGLAERRAAAGDRRSYALYLTVEGETLMRKLKPILKAHEERLLAGLGEDGRRQLVSLLRRLVSDAPESDGARGRLRPAKEPRPLRVGSAGT